VWPRLTKYLPQKGSYEDHFTLLFYRHSDQPGFNLTAQGYSSRDDHALNKPFVEVLILG
jgi:hypothetical protein